MLSMDEQIIPGSMLLDAVTSEALHDFACHAVLPKGEAIMFQAFLVDWCHCSGLPIGRYVSGYHRLLKSEVKGKRETAPMLLTIKD